MPYYFKLTRLVLIIGIATSIRNSISWSPLCLKLQCLIERVSKRQGEKRPLASLFYTKYK